MNHRVRVLLCVLLVAWCGQAVAEAPVNQLTFDPSKTAFLTASGETIAQHVTDPERYRPGAAILTLRYLDTRTVNNGVYLGSIDEARHLSWVPNDQYAIAIGQSEPGQPIVVFLPYAGWQANVTYAVRVKPTVLDLLAKPIVEEDTTWTFRVMPVADGEGTPTEARPRPQETVAEQTLGGRIPGGQNFLFQGAWTDPVTGLAYHRGRWYDPRTASFLTPDPEGDIDSVNQYGFVAGRPHAATDPLGTHVFRQFEVNGQTIHASSPTLDEIHNGQFVVSYRYEVDGRSVSQICDQQCGLTWTMYAKVFPDSIFSESWEAFYGHPISAVEESLLKLYGRAVWDIKEEVALATFFSMVPIVAEAGPGTTAAVRGARAAPRINLLNTRVGTNASVQELNALAEAGAVAPQAAAGTASGAASGAARAARYGSNWQRASLDEAVERIAGPNPVVKLTDSGKQIFRNPDTGLQVVYDSGGNYFRIENPSVEGVGRYLDLYGKEIPSNVPLVGPRGTSQTGVPKDVRNALTHFLNSD